MMTLARWNPFREMEDVLDRYNRSVGRRPSLHGEGGRETMTIADWAPAVDIIEADDEYRIKVELPEVRREDVAVAVNQGVLTIQGERKAEREENNKKYHRVERAYGRFVRSFSLPEGVNEDGVRARFKDGMLSVHIAKAEPVKPKSVQVEID